MRRSAFSFGVLLGTVLVSLAAPPCFAQEANAGDELQQLIAAEKTAVDSGDPAQILASGSQLGITALNLLGRLYTGQQQCGAAADTFAHAFQLSDAAASSPAHLQIGVALVGAAACAGRAAVVESTSASLLQSQGDTAQMHLLLANAHHTADDLPGTIAELNRAVALDPQSSPAHLALGNAYWELNEYQYNAETLREFEAAQRLAPDDPYSNQLLGAVLSQYERYSDAATYLERAVAEDASSPDSLLQLGMNAYAENQPQEAYRFLQKAVVLTGEDVARGGYQIRRAYVVLSRLAAQRGNQDEAQKFSEQESAIHAQMVRSGAATQLSESTATVVQTRPDAHAPKETSAAVEPRLEQTLRVIIASSLNDAGTVLARQHDYAGAMPFFRAAAWSKPDQSPVMRNLGLAAFHSGAFAEAAAALAVAVDQNPDDALARDDLQQARTQLQQKQP